MEVGGRGAVSVHCLSGCAVVLGRVEEKRSGNWDLGLQGWGAASSSGGLLATGLGWRWGVNP